MTARYEIERMICGALNTLQLVIGVPIVVGRTAKDRKGNYVVVNSEEEKFSTPLARVGFVEVDIISVVDLDLANAAEDSQRRIETISQFLASEEAIDLVRDAGTPEMTTWPYALILRDSTVLKKDRSRGDSIHVSVSVGRMNS